jgi:hypothetical protein
MEARRGAPRFPSDATCLDGKHDGKKPGLFMAEISDFFIKPIE